MSEERYRNILLYGQTDGTRPTGGPRKKWIDNIQEDCSAMGLSLIEADRLASDRNRWRFGCQRASTINSFVFVAKALSQVQSGVTVAAFYQISGY